MSESNGDSGDGSTASMEMDDLALNSPDVKHAWTPDAAAMIEEHIVYHAKMILDLNKGLTEGPNKSYKAPCKPDSNVLNVLKGVRPKKASAKAKMVSVHNMTDIDFDRYLRGLMVDERDACVIGASTELLTMSDVADKINALHKELSKACNNSLRKAIELGENLNVAYDKFVAEKRESGLGDTWKNWIESFTTMSESYSRKLRKMADLVGKYPKLIHLGVCYSDFFKMHAKIKTVFAKHVSIANRYK